MIKVGITGGIGSGKTSVSRIFELLGIPVFYADSVAKTLMNDDTLLIAGIKERFGTESYSYDGLLNRAYLASEVFSDASKLEHLNQLVHPAVFRAFDRWVKAQAGKAPYVLKEAALLFESNSFLQCDRSILVIAPISVRMQRVMARDQISETQVRARMDKQWSDEQKAKLADDTIYNTEDKSLILQVLHLHQEFLKLT